MDVQIHRDALIQAVQQVSRAVSTRTTIPILTGIYMQVDDSGMTLIGSDADISIQVHIPLQEEEEERIRVNRGGQLVLPARYFGELVRKMPDEWLQVVADTPEVAQLTSGRSQTQLHGFLPDEYPRLPQVFGEKSWRMPSDLLKTMLRQTTYCVSHSETRPILTGVLWEIREGTLSMIATDSHRLAKREAPVEVPEGLQVEQLVVPGKSLGELSRLLEDGEEEVEIVLSGNQVLFRTPRMVFYSRLLEGSYPNTSTILQQRRLTSAVVSTQEMLEAMERVSLLARENKNHLVKCTVKEQEPMQLLSESAEIGFVREQVHIEKLEGEDYKISFNARYMMEALRTVDDPYVIITYTGPMNPIILQPQSQDSLIVLIQPVRS